MCHVASFSDNWTRHDDGMVHRKMEGVKVTTYTLCLLGSNILKFIPIHLCVTRDSMADRAFEWWQWFSRCIHILATYKVKTCKMNGIFTRSTSMMMPNTVAAVALIVLFICKQANIPLFDSGVTQRHTLMVSALGTCNSTVLNLYWVE